MKKVLYGLLLIAALMCGVWLAQQQFPHPSDAPPGQAGKVLYQGATGSAAVGGAFKLASTRGHDVTHLALLGHYSLLYFGYTFCPDICPMALDNISRAVDQLSPEQQEKVQLYFITIDPHRDTLAKLTGFIPAFGPKWQALTGTQAQVEAAMKAYGVYGSKVQDKNATTPYYLMDHSSIVYLMGPKGEYLGHVTHATPPTEILALLKKVMLADPIAGPTLTQS